MPVPMFPINSSHLNYVGWEDNTLYITFSRGHRYKYFDVPKEVYEELRNSSSPGNYFRDNIKDVFKTETI